MNEQNFGQVAATPKQDGLLLTDLSSGSTRFATWRERIAIWLLGSTAVRV